jgi:hypothetical protein
MIEEKRREEKRREEKRREEKREEEKRVEGRREEALALSGIEPTTQSSQCNPLAYMKDFCYEEFIAE